MINVSFLKLPFRKVVFTSKCTISYEDPHWQSMPTQLLNGIIFGYRNKSFSKINSSQL